MQVLAIDVGETHVKLLASGEREPRRLDSGPNLTAGQMAVEVKKLASGWAYGAVSIGYPGRFCMASLCMRLSILLPGG